MKQTKQDRMINLVARLSKLGLSSYEITQLLRIERTLQRWAELECGDGNDHASWVIERDEETDKPHFVTYPHTGKSYRRPIADREAGALRRLAGIMATHPDLVAYHQGDPRGCAIYIVSKSELGDRSLSSCYTIGVAVAA